ncbi:alpha/beta fold hydrolase [Marinagarivorans algicola]|uniref:alpha/beta fold hydrolase n=1 Tax=Marinagarivorans algicola TaxID=1513270 RepID=UPI0006B5505A|nr:alpha/beta hydrolase [Marinagarivorans algicola]
MKKITQMIVGLVSASCLALSMAVQAGEEGFIDIETGQVLHYLAEGEPGKPLLLFLHGAPERAEVWQDYLKAFSQDYYTVAYTSRGYYPSTIPTEVADYSVTTLAADAVAVAKALGYEKFTVVGHDWGGATAWRTAINYPNNVERAVIFANPHPLMYARAYHESDKQRALIDAYVPLARDDIAPWSREATLANNVAHFKRDVYTEEAKNRMDWSLGLALEEMWLANNGASIDAIYNHYKALDWPLTTLNTCNPAPSFSLTVSQPVLVFYGEQDRFNSGEAYRLPNNDCTPNAKYVKYKKGDHWIHQTRKYNAIKHMKTFFSKNPAH